MADDKKIIIDEDWKAQVQAEKAAAAEDQVATTIAKEPAATPQADEPSDMPMPPASFEMLLTTLATEALVSLGEVPHPATGKLHSHPHQAKYLIDTIDVLKQKTKGNLTPLEQQAIDSMLHQLRMIFIAKANQPQPEGSASQTP